MESTEKEGKKMAVWGIGAYFPAQNKDMSQEFYNIGKIIIGYSEEEHPDYYRLLRSIKAGDIVFIKARHKMSNYLRIKAIGIATTYQTSKKDGTEEPESVCVSWIKNFINDKPDKYKFEKERFVDGSKETIYQERDEKVIKWIAELLKDEEEQEKGKDTK